MNTDLTKRRGTIANYLTKNCDKLWACGNNVKKMRAVALQLLDSSTLTDKEAVEQAKHIFKTAKDNLFISCLITYMTGDTVTFNKRR